LDMGLVKVSSTCAAGTTLCTAECPTGKKVLSGGYYESTVTATKIIGSYPADTLTRWYVRALSAIGIYGAYAVCGRVQ